MQKLVGFFWRMTRWNQTSALIACSSNWCKECHKMQFRVLWNMKTAFYLHHDLSQSAPLVIKKISYHTQIDPAVGCNKSNIFRLPVFYQKQFCNLNSVYPWIFITLSEWRPHSFERRHINSSVTRIIKGVLNGVRKTEPGRLPSWFLFWNQNLFQKHSDSKCRIFSCSNW